MLQVQVNKQTIIQTDQQNGVFTLNGKEFPVDIVKIDDQKFHLINNNKSYNCEIISSNSAEKELIIRVNGNEYALSYKNDIDLLLEKMGINTLSEVKINEVKAPMPGMVLRILVSIGDEVKKGDPILVLESMKMENVLKSPGNGVVDQIVCRQGKSVEKADVLLKFA
jgi:biotin carboxyl carrier protein